MYFTIATKIEGKWGIEFGSEDLEDIESQLEELVRDGYGDDPTVILVTDADQLAINEAFARLK